MSAPAEDYVRRVTDIKRVHDGDTYLLEIDQGMGDRRVAWVRLHNIDCWELSQQLGEKARSFAETALLVADEVVIQTFKTSGGEDVTSFIRYVADVWVDGQPLAPMLRTAGYEKVKI